jgi:hypothetical protein
MHQSQEAALFSRARGHRTTAQEPCIVARESGMCFAATLCNVSQDGFCVESSAALQVGEVIQLRLLGALFSGTISWTDGRRAGGLLVDVPSRLAAVSAAP